MIRNGAVDGVLAWCPKEVWNAQGKVLVLDLFNNGPNDKGYKVFYIDINGNESETRTFDYLSTALVYFAKSICVEELTISKP